MGTRGEKWDAWKVAKSFPSVLSKPSPQGGHTGTPRICSEHWRGDNLIFFLG